MINIENEDIIKLLKHFSSNLYYANNSNDFCHEVMEKCIALAQVDYDCFTIDNSEGELSNHYPAQIIFLENEQSNPNGNGRTTGTIYESTYDKNNIQELMQNARFARCRTRFPVPVILYKGKYVCRSATLSLKPEMYGRHGLQQICSAFTATTTPTLPALPTQVTKHVDEKGLACEKSTEEIEAQGSNSKASFLTQDLKDACEDETEIKNNSNLSNSTPIEDKNLCDYVRHCDSCLLKKFNINAIVNLMVENFKVKYGFSISSSEKAEQNCYQDFNLISLPYPGCEFFKEFHDKSYEATDLFFDWKCQYFDAELCIPIDLSSQFKINWEDYKKWDLITLTQNYLKLLIRNLYESNSGILIHCVSGWDRTPLFVSLLRISLWADGVIHQKLNASQLLYFTLAYDWMLFGHNLYDRLSKHEDILFFCFYVLKYIIGEEFCITTQSRKCKANNIGSPNFQNSCSTVRTECEYLSDGILSEDPRGSNISLNSVCSSVSSKDQEPVPKSSPSSQDDSNGNPSSNSTGSNSPLPVPRSSSSSLNQRRTSPIPVPTKETRQRSDSTSSVSIGSWEMISKTGSFRGSARILDSCSSGYEKLNIEMAAGAEDETDPLIHRAQALNEVRTLLITTYANSCGFQMKSAESMFSNFLKQLLK